MCSLGCLSLAEDAVPASDYPTVPQERAFVYSTGRQLYCIIYDPSDCYHYPQYPKYSVYCLSDCHFHPLHTQSRCLILALADTNEYKWVSVLRFFKKIK